MTSRAFVETAVTAEVERSRARVSSGAGRGLSWSDHVTLFVIGLVVVLVSLPRLRRFALRENEHDALRMLHVLGAEAQGRDRATPLALSELLAARTQAESRFEDVEILPDGSLRRHGYLFDVVSAQSGARVVRAWPWDHGRTGLGAFAYVAGRELLGHPNADGRFSGSEHRPPLALDEQTGWRALPRP